MVTDYSRQSRDHLVTRPPPHHMTEPARPGVHHKEQSPGGASAGPGVAQSGGPKSLLRGPSGLLLTAAVLWAGVVTVATRGPGVCLH